MNYLTYKFQTDKETVSIPRLPQTEQVQTATEKIVRKEVRKLEENSEEIRKLREQIEKSNKPL